MLVCVCGGVGVGIRGRYAVVPQPPPFVIAILDPSGSILIHVYAFTMIQRKPLIGVIDRFQKT